MIRIAQHNDWVVWILVGCIFIYIFMLISLRRDSGVLEFLLQKFPDSTNNFLSWMIISVVFSLTLSVLVSPYLPAVPKTISTLQIGGYELNKFGYTFLAISAFYFMKNTFSYLFFAGTGSAKKWEVFYFTASKFYFSFSLIIMILCVISNFYIVDRAEMFNICIVGLAAIFLFKLSYYLFHSSRILPEIWYYKILYICTLQIVPVLVLWKVLFF